MAGHPPFILVKIAFYSLIKIMAKIEHIWTNQIFANLSPLGLILLSQHLSKVGPLECSLIGLCWPAKVGSIGHIFGQISLLIL